MGWIFVNINLRKSSPTYDDFHKIVGLPRGPVFPGHLCSASKDRLNSWFKDKVVPTTKEKQILLYKNQGTVMMAQADMRSTANVSRLIPG